MSRPHHEDTPLSKYERNDLFRVIEASGVPVTDFELDERVASTKRGSVPITVIRHSSTGSAFVISVHRRSNPTEQKMFLGQWEIDGSEESMLIQWPAASVSIYPWSTIVRMAKEWTEKIRKHLKEIERIESEWIRQAEEYERTPDLWDERCRGREFFARQDEQGLENAPFGSAEQTRASEQIRQIKEQDEQDLENAPFDSAEQTRISEQIRQIKIYIRNTHELTSEGISRVEARLDHAEEASRRIGRKDWLVMFNGAVLSLAFTDLITPQTAQHVILMTIHSLSHLFGIGGSLPHLPPSG